MSFSFSVRARTKDAAGVAVEAKLGEVVVAQPAHDRDRQAIQNATEASINTLAEPGDGECVAVSVSGSLGWRAEGEFTHVNLTVYASLSALTDEERAEAAGAPA